MGQLEAETRPSFKKISKDTNLGDSIKILVDMMIRSKTWLQLIYWLFIFFYNKNNFVLIYIKK
jgi:hypothetical protein